MEEEIKSRLLKRKSHPDCGVHIVNFAARKLLLLLKNLETTPFPLSPAQTMPQKPNAYMREG